MTSLIAPFSLAGSLQTLVQLLRPKLQVGNQEAIQEAPSSISLVSLAKLWHSSRITMVADFSLRGLSACLSIICL